MTLHIIKPERATLHGHFSRELAPVLTIDPGESVQFRTLDAGWGLEPWTSFDTPRAMFEPRVAGVDDGHALCGPIAIRGAQPGTTLAVHIEEIRPGRWGWSLAGGRQTLVNRRLGIDPPPGILHIWTLDPDALTGRNQHGHTVALRPFMGVMGMPPDEPGQLPTNPPRTTGGNLDCKELVAGSVLYLPIAVAGGLFSTGDGHGVQGDGEASGVALECPMERVTLRFELHDDLRISMPRANTPAGWLTFGLHADLNEATLQALEGMIDMMSEQHNLDRRDALALASLLVDLRITQIANGVHGVHAVLPHGALE